jgi:hypothetical protein
VQAAIDEARSRGSAVGNAGSAAASVVVSDGRVVAVDALISFARIPQDELPLLFPTGLAAYLHSRAAARGEAQAIARHSTSAQLHAIKEAHRRMAQQCARISAAFGRDESARARLFRKMDSRHTPGLLDASEFVAACRTVLEVPAPHTVTTRTRACNGRTRAPAGRAFVQMGDVDPCDVLAVFEMIDCDGTKQIELTELSAFISLMPHEVEQMALLGRSLYSKLTPRQRAEAMCRVVQVSGRSSLRGACRIRAVARVCIRVCARARARVCVQEAFHAAPNIDLETWDPAGRLSPQFPPIVLRPKSPPKPGRAPAAPAAAPARSDRAQPSAPAAAAPEAAGGASRSSHAASPRTAEGVPLSAAAAAAVEPPALAAVAPLRAVVCADGGGAHARAARSLARADGSIPLVLTRAQFGQVGRAMERAAKHGQPAERPKGFAHGRFARASSARTGRSLRRTRCARPRTPCVCACVCVSKCARCRSSGLGVCACVGARVIGVQ